MTYEELIEEAGAAIGIEEFGVELSAEDEMLLVSADAGAVDLEGGDEPLLKMLEANHMYSGTEGASFSLDGEHAKLERLVCLDAFCREGGKSILMSLFSSVQAWREGNKT